MQLLTSLLKVSPRYQRAINLAASADSACSLDGYIITPNILEALQRIIGCVHTNTSSRAFSLYGPYGTGKSSFSVFLTQLLSKDNTLANNALSFLESHAPDLLENCRQARGNGFLTISVTARKQAPGRIFCESIATALSKIKKTTAVSQLKEHLERILSQELWKDSSEVLGVFKELSALCKKQGFSGVLFILDEAGKILEYALQDNIDGDLYLFQEVAEFANHQEFPFILLISLHQLFDEYVELADKTMRAEWNKVQERFESIPFAESGVATMRMISAAIQHPLGLPTPVLEAIGRELHQLKASNIRLPIGLSEEEFRELSIKAWPIHPLSLLIMPWLFRNLGQNERSIFTWLSNEEPHSFQHFIHSHTTDDDHGFIRLAEFYRFFTVNFASSLARLPQGRSLLDAEAAIEEHPSMSESCIRLLETIGILSVRGILSAHGKGRDLLACSVSAPQNIDRDIKILKQSAVITYYRLHDSYRIGEGSDIDIAERIEEARAHLKNDHENLLETFKSFLSEKYIVARRHALQTGTHRYFDVSFVANLNSYSSKKDADACGQIIVLLPFRNISTLCKEALQATKLDDTIVVAIPHQMDVLLNLVEEMACLEWVAENTPGLRNDRAARRQLDLRRVECSTNLEKQAQWVLDPRPAPAGNACRYFYNGEVQSIENFTGVIRLVSDICDNLYNKAPRILNELIARKNISSAAALARRIVMEGVLERSHMEALGIVGFPAEMSVYASVLKQGGLHTYDEKTQTWRLTLPEKEEDRLNLRPCFELMEQEIFNSKAERVELTALFQKMSDRPYGIPEGLHPLLFTIFWYLHRKDLFLYRENSFLPAPSLPHFELLQRRPKLFSVSGIRIAGARRQLIEKLARMLDVEPDTVTVTKQMFVRMFSLPVITQRTNKLENQSALKMRRTFMLAQEPEKLMFVDLPLALGSTPFTDVGLAPSLVETYVQRLKACLDIFEGFAPKQEENCRAILLEACGLEATEKGWKELIDISSKLAPRIKDEEFSPFLANVVRKDGTSSTQQVLSFIGKKAFEQWSDAEIDRFPELAKNIGEKFRYYCKFALGDILLSPAEKEKTEEVVDQIKKKIQALKKKYPEKVVLAALQEFMLNSEE